MNLLLEVVGWLGMVLLVLAYGLVSYGKVKYGDLSYQILNLLGALGVGINLFYHQAWPGVGLQVVWALIAVAALIGIKKAR